MKKSQILAKAMVGNAGISSKSGSFLLFNENYISSKYAERFKVKENADKFEKAFRIVTGGVGNELNKINSVLSSSLLSLLSFYPLFENESNDVCLNISLNGTNYTFTKVFFEIRNKVVGYPSCVDVILVDNDGCMLFLESKFTEFIDDKSLSKSYGISYLKLYENLTDMLSKGGIDVTKSSNKMKLSSKDGEKYIEGIKQSISHLIGILKGPQDVIDGAYDKEYLNSYKEAFKRAPKLFYGTILFDPSDVAPAAREDFKEYKELYENIIGNPGEEIVGKIADWCNCDIQDPSKIEVLKEPLTYQDLLKRNPQYKKSLPKEVIEFYHFS